MSRDDFTPGYRHTQTGPWWVLLAVLGLGMIGAAWALRETTPAALVLGAVGPLMLLLAAAFQRLVVEDAGDHLSVRFGPLPLAAKRIPYASMESVEAARTTLLDGWGVHMSPRGGWVWNIWGRACVCIRHGKTTWLGTDDAEALVRFLTARIARVG